MTLENKVIVSSLIFRGLFVWGKLGNGNPLQHSCLENPMGGGA